MKTPQIKRFKGLNNVDDPLRLGLGWLSRADNINITSTGAIERRAGFTEAIIGDIRGVFATRDETRMYFVDGARLLAVLDDMSTVELRTGLVSREPMRWAEVGEDVYFTNGTDSGIIARAGDVRDWAWSVPNAPTLSATAGQLAAGEYRVCFTYLLADGRETGAGEWTSIVVGEGSALQIADIPQQPGCTTQVYLTDADGTAFQLAFGTSLTAASWNDSPDALGIDLMTTSLDPLPPGATHPTLWRGQLYTLQYDPSTNTTVIWYSEPLGYHLFDLSKNFLLVPGRGVLLAPHDDGLVIGTDAKIYTYDGDKLDTLAPYGVVPGWSQAEDEDERKVLFWTTRGLCSALPFANLTLRQVSVAPGVQAGAAIVREDGAKRYVVSVVKGGVAYNPHHST